MQPRARGGHESHASAGQHGGHHVTLAVLPTESPAFPHAAHALTDSLKRADIAGVDKKHFSKVSLEVVQLSIECVEPSAHCYAKVGKSLSANRLLFGQIAKADHHVEVAVTLFDVDAHSPHTTKKRFATEQQATAGIQELVAEATR